MRSFSSGLSVGDEHLNEEVLLQVVSHPVMSPEPHYVK